MSDKYTVVSLYKDNNQVRVGQVEAEDVEQAEAIAQQQANEDNPVDGDSLYDSLFELRTLAVIEGHPEVVFVDDYYEDKGADDEYEDAIYDSMFELRTLAVIAGHPEVVFVDDYYED